MKTYVASQACCATCANWAGPRMVKHNGSYVDVDTTGTMGKCYAGKNSSSQGNPSCHKCDKYQKWAALK